MPTYIVKDSSSDLSPSWPNTTQFDALMSTGTGGTGGNAISLTSLQIKSASYITPANIPNSDTFEDSGIQTIEAVVPAGSMNIRARCRMVRLDASGNILGVKGAFTGFQTLQANRIFSPVSPVWTGTELCTDRLCVEWEFESLDAMMTVNATLATGTITEEIITDITENNGSCSGPVGGEPQEYAFIMNVLALIFIYSIF